MGLDALALQRTRETLANLEGYRGEFSDVSVSVLHLSYSVHGLKIVPEPRGGTGAQLSFGAKRLEIALVASELVRRRARVLRVELDDPKLEVGGLGGPRNGTPPRLGSGRALPEGSARRAQFAGFDVFSRRNRTSREYMRSRASSS